MESFSLSAAIVIATVSFLVGFVSNLILDRKGVSLEKRVALIILLSWLSFAMIAYLQDRDLSIFFNAAGLGAVGNLLGIKTSELFGNFILRK